MPLSRFQPSQYDALLAEKTKQLETKLSAFTEPSASTKLPLSVFASESQGFRCRAEFRFWHEENDSYYVMYRKGENDTPIRIDHFPFAHPNIQALMPAIRQGVLEEPVLRERLFQVEFLSSLSGNNLVTLIYHKKLDDLWQEKAQALANTLNIELIGRSRKQKLTLTNDYIDECLTVNDKTLHYRQYESSFTQPNGKMNQQMLSWAEQQLSAGGTDTSKTDLLELYCGNGNFTNVLAPRFNQVLATEISKASVKAAKYSFEKNQISNVKICRMSSEELTQAITGVREFSRLKQQAINLADYNFSTVFVDPPRAGLDDDTLQLVSQFQQILYISCNPETLCRNLEQLTSTHRIASCALFDQFPYTDHIESGVLLLKK